MLSLSPFPFPFPSPDEEWSSPLYFPDDNGEMRDITQFSYKQYKRTVIHGAQHERHYFCKTKYPTEGGLSGEGFKKLSLDIQRAAVLSGFTIYKNGKPPISYLGIENAQQYSCCRSLRYKSQQKKSTVGTPYRVRTTVNDRRNSRGPEGIKMCRRTSSKRPLDASHVCKYKFFVHYDINGFYVVPGIGNTSHRHHSKLGPEDYCTVAPRLRPKLDDINKRKKTYNNKKNEGDKNKKVKKEDMFIEETPEINRANSKGKYLDDHELDTSDEEDSDSEMSGCSDNKIYKKLKPSFEALTSIMESNCDKKDIAEIENYFSELINKFTKRAISRLPTLETPKL